MCVIVSRVEGIGVGLRQRREHRSRQRAAVHGLRSSLSVDLVLEVGQAPLELRPQ